MRETTDDEVIGFMAKWVGWMYEEHGLYELPFDNVDEGEYRTLPDLAEAVRVKWIALPQRDKDMDRAQEVWLFRGPASFLRAVMEVVKGE